MLQASSVLQGRIRFPGTYPAPSAPDFQARVKHDEKHEQKVDGAQCAGAQIADQVSAQGADEFPGLAQDGFFVDEDLIEIG